MGRMRGAVNLRRFNDQRGKQYIVALKHELEKVRKANIQFAKLGALSKYIAPRAGIHRTTLTRNPKYRMLLLSHLATQKGVVHAISDDDASPELLRAKLLASRLEISSLRGAVSRLKRALNVTEEGGDSDDGGGRVVIRNDNQHSYRLKFVDTAMVLMLVLERLKDSILVNRDSRTIEDLAARPSERIVAGPKRTIPFMDWYEQNCDLLHRINEEQ